MKLNKYILSLCVSVATLLSACDTDNEGAIYGGGDNAGITFELATQSVSFPSTGYEGFDVEVLRAKTAGELTIDVTASLVNGGELEPLPSTISVPSTLTFKDGEFKTNIHVSVGDITPGQNYQIIINLPETHANIDFIGSKTVTIFRDYTYSVLGTGTFQSTAMAEEGQDYAEWEVEVQKANQVEWYKAIGLYEEGLDVVFKVNSNEVTVDSQPAWTDATYGKVHVAGSGKLENGVIAVKLEHSIPGVGSYGSYNETLILPVSE